MPATQTFVAHDVTRADEPAVLQAVVQQEPLLASRIVLSCLVTVPDPVATAAALQQHQAQLDKLRVRPRPRTPKPKKTHHHPKKPPAAPAAAEAPADAAPPPPPPLPPPVLWADVERTKQRLLVVTPAHVALYHPQRLVAPGTASARRGRLHVERTSRVPVAAVLLCACCSELPAPAPAASRCSPALAARTVWLATTLGSLEFALADAALAARVVACIRDCAAKAAAAASGAASGEGAPAAAAAAAPS